MGSTVSQYMLRIRERLVQVVASGREPVDRIVLHPLQRPGKLVRSQLVLLSSSLFGGINERVIDVAVAIECIHTASLVHDDIVDGACLRRGIPTINHLFSSQAAVLAGDHLFATAFEILAGHRLNDILSEVTRAIKQMCAGEITQDLNLFNTCLSESDYLDNIYGKTASLFGAACRCGALAVGGSPQEVEQVGLFGEYLGYAYQIADDVMDFCGEQTTLGKPCGSDLKNGVITLPVIRALAVSDFHSELLNTIESYRLEPDAITRVIEILEECGAIRYAASRASDYCLQASRILESFPPSIARSELLSLCSSLIKLPMLTDKIPQPAVMQMPAEVELCLTLPESPGCTIT
ncbi:MAG: polyprenyl synthetase family protein [Bacillota bacterium]